MTSVPRHRQTPISFRSDRAAVLLSRLTASGKSQAKVIEEALEKAVNDQPKMSSAEFIARVDAIVKPLHGLKGPSREEIEAEMYDEYGAPR
jgi:hypothetical protein